MANTPENYAEQEKNDPLTKALESLREEDNTMGDTSPEPTKEDYNWQLHEKNQELERQVAYLTGEVEARMREVHRLNGIIEKHFNVIKDLASALTVR